MLGIEIRQESPSHSASLGLLLGRGSDLHDDRFGWFRFLDRVAVGVGDAGDRPHDGTAEVIDLPPGQGVEQVLAHCRRHRPHRGDSVVRSPRIAKKHGEPEILIGFEDGVEMLEVAEPRESQGTPERRVWIAVRRHRSNLARLDVRVLQRHGGEGLEDLVAALPRLLEQTSRLRRVTDLGQLVVENFAIGIVRVGCDSPKVFPKGEQRHTDRDLERAAPITRVDGGVAQHPVDRAGDREPRFLLERQPRGDVDGVETHFDVLVAFSLLQQGLDEPCGENLGHVVLLTDRWLRRPRSTVRCRNSPVVGVGCTACRSPWFFQCARPPNREGSTLLE